ncbi:MAG: cysteine desulfurase [Bacteroidota bacterium]
MIPPADIRSHFPIFQTYPDLVYLDNAATTQKPQAVIDGIQKFYVEENANIHRGIYPLALKATQAYESVRQKVANAIHTPDPTQIVYTSGTTEGINLVAHSFLTPRLREGDEVIISSMEHHANLIPWQIACKKVGAHLKVLPISELGEIRVEDLEAMLTEKTRFLAVVHISNTLGTINPIEEMIGLAHHKGVPVLIDAAQSMAYYDINVEELDVDFLVFSGHKIFGPTGTGILYGKKVHLEQMEPYQVGGDMIKEVSYEETTFAGIPQRFEAGTTNIAGIVGLGYALDYLSTLPHQDIQKHIQQLTTYCTENLLDIPGLEIIGRAAKKSGIISFTMKEVHPHDVATMLGEVNIAVRAGHHCTQPLMETWELPGTTRVSFSIYNSMEDVNKLVEAVRQTQLFFA